MPGKNILVTGASGFTGRHFIEAAKRSGYHCTALCAHEHESVQGADRQLIGNLNDAVSLQRALIESRPDKVLHLAALAFVAHDDAAAIYQTNLLGTLNLLDAISRHAPDIEKVLLASSANIYGNSAALPITEDTTPDPVNHYGISKYATEKAAALFRELPIVTVRPFNYTGVGQSANFLVPKIVNAFRNKAAAIELGNIDVARDFSDVRDVVSAYLRLLDSAGSHLAYNICSGEATSLSTIIASLNDLAGYAIKVEVNPAFVRANEIKTLRGSPQRLESTIGDFRSFKLVDTLEWMLNFDRKLQ